MRGINKEIHQPLFVVMDYSHMRGINRTSSTLGFQSSQDHSHMRGINFIS